MQESVLPSRLLPRLQHAREQAAYFARIALDFLLIGLGGALVWFLTAWGAGVLLLEDDAPLATPAPERHALKPQAAEPYAFDDLPREIDGALACPAIGLIDYGGTSLRLIPPVRVATPFREHVLALEQVTRETALRVYGRAPSALLVAASYDCRPVTRNRGRLSEHALGNAIDITAIRFDADPATKDPALDVRVDRHWKARGDGEQHARFLQMLTDELLRRKLFRTLLGPAHPDHRDHFHFDMAPHHYVAL